MLWSFGYFSFVPSRTSLGSGASILRHGTPSLFAIRSDGSDGLAYLPACLSRLVGLEMDHHHPNAQADIRCNESYNNLLKHLVDSAPAIGLPLLSSRAQIKKALGLGVRGVSLRWTKVRPMAEKVLDFMQEHASAGACVQNEADRWGAAADHVLPDDKSFKEKYHDCVPSARTTPSLKWVSVFQLLLGKHLPVPDADSAILIHPKVGKKTIGISTREPFAPQDLWICVAKNHSMCWLVRLCTVLAGDEVIARVVFPFVIKSTRQLFLPFFEQVQERREGERAVTMHNLQWFAAETEFYAKVKLRGDVLFNLRHHQARPCVPRVPKPGDGAGAAGSHPIEDAGGGGTASGSSGGGDGGDAASSGASGSADAAAAVHVDADGNIIYEEEIIDALCEELCRADSHDEMGDRFGDWVSGDKNDTEEDFSKGKQTRFGFHKYFHGAAFFTC